MCSSRSSSSSAVTFESDTSDGEDTNPFIPRNEFVQEAFVRSKALWQGYLDKARMVPFPSVELPNLLHRLPAIPDDLENVSFLQGQSTWELKSAQCDLRKRTAMAQRWGLTRGRPTTCDWLPSDSKVRNENSGVAILFFGWAYILCARLLEKQRLPMQYTSEMAGSDVETQGSAGDNCLIISVGDTTADELRWWKALLAPGQGWRTTTVPENALYLPWSVSCAGRLIFKLVTTSKCLPSDQLSGQPPSSIQAARYLSKFIAIYNLDCEVSPALAMALMLPLHNETNAIVRLPQPRLILRSYADLGNTLPHYEYLSQYMTLSSNSRFLSSALWSVFWEPGVDCNLVSPWCDGIIEVLEPLIDNDELQLLAQVLALRRPNLGPLWYGVAFCGRTKTIDAIVPFLKTLFPPTPGCPIPDVAAWTGSPQSFMDLCGSGAYLQEGNTICRSDVWRLRHECWQIEPDGASFKCPPLSGWPPFGAMQVDDLEIEIHRHIRCVRHQWNYAHWAWHLRDNEEIIDQGYNNDITENRTEPIESSQQALCHQNDYRSNNVATERAVEGAFRWAATQIEFGNKSLYTHRWVAADIRMPSPAGSPISSSDTQMSDDAIQKVQIWRKEVQ